jgi:hypothetical protein
MNAPKGKDLLSNWKDGESICMVFEDLKSQHKTADEINGFIRAVKVAASHYDFDLTVWGLKPHFESYLNKEYARNKWHEGGRAMVDKLIKEYVTCDFLRHFKIVTPDFEK